MKEKMYTVLDASLYDKEGLCPGIELRKHVAGELEEVGAFRAQEDWRHLVGPLPKPYAGALGPDFSFVTISVPDCLPERMEIVAYALEFGFIHDGSYSLDQTSSMECELICRDVIDTDVNSASLEEVKSALDQGQGGKTENRGSDGKRKIVTQIIREMMAIDPAGAMNVAKSWSSGVGHSDRRKEDTEWKSLEEYIPYRALDVGYMLWHGLVCFGCAITVPKEEDEEAQRLIMPALIQASLLNDIFSFEKEKDDANVQNAVLIVMNENGCGEKEAQEILKDRVRLECTNYVRNVRETQARTDVSDELKRYLDVMQYTLSGNAAWSPICPRYNGPTKYNELQMLRGKHGLAKYPGRYKLEAKTNGATNNGSGNKRKRDGADEGPKRNGKNGVRKPAPPVISATLPTDVMQLAVNCNLPDLNDIVCPACHPFRNGAFD
jgi:ophiobolin F synthase